MGETTILGRRLFPSSIRNHLARHAARASAQLSVSTTRGERTGIVKSKFILALGGQRSPLVLDATTAAEAQFTNSWISSLGGFCTCPLVNESN
jgi:hypothetical protein